MFNKILQNAFNDQIQKEFYSSYLYLAMAAHFESANLPGFASWMKKQAEEERSHAMKLWDYVCDRGGKVELQAVEQPPVTYGKPLEAFQLVLAHEQKVTASIEALYALAQKEADAAAHIFLQWFVQEQVEEEKSVTDLIEQLKMSGDQPFSILFMDKHVLGARK
ncbi:MAG TPA: ferritin [Rhizomicrobium sp.]|nr:ferritin [Rhizomicrobium sp.]